MGLGNDYILDRLSKIEVLPTFPDVVGEVMKVIEDPMSSATDLAKSLDPSMAGEILRVANTAYYGTRNFRNITSIEHAIAIIGFENLSHIVLNMPFMSMIQSDSVFDRTRYITHSLVCAVLSRTISDSTGVANPGEVYLGGLMHDVGTVIIYRYFHDEWDRMRTLVNEKGITWTAAETEILSFDHGYLGAELLNTWNIPRSVTDGVRYHHCPEVAEENKGHAIVINLGNKFAKRIDLRDNFSSFDEFLNNYRDVVELVRDLGVDLAPSTELKFFEKAFIELRNTKGFFEGVLEEKHD